MTEIHKYTLTPVVGEKQRQSIGVEMHNEAKILSVQNQKDAIVVWVSEDPDKPKVTRRFALRLTGEHTPDCYYPYCVFLGTVQLFNWDFVVHVFEVA